MDWVWGLVVLLVVFWVVGLVLKVGTKLIHLLLVAAVLIALAQLTFG